LSFEEPHLTTLVGATGLLIHIILIFYRKSRQRATVNLLKVGSAQRRISDDSGLNENQPDIENNKYGYRGPETNPLNLQPQSRSSSKPLSYFFHHAGDGWVAV